jgi:hypothetical protein
MLGLVVRKVNAAYRAIENVTEGCDVAPFVMQPNRKSDFREVRLGSTGRREYLRAIYKRYQTTGRKGKKVISSEYCANTG